MHKPSKHLYLVTLCGMPEAFGERRRELEAAFRAGIDCQYGDQVRAAEALHMLVDGDLKEPNLPWPRAVAMAMQQLASRLPPGATFDCDLNWPEISKPD
ncbi:MAG: hypothetical protein JWQ76_4536 [Ramlibacter sp.]|nr:hypothetical protein [Ramlibacter sp.]